ncbi:Phytanoyl-CoA dioxygenase [Penicillium brevicompactum]|uniref:Phytanoyl-CoA dioxygenase n=1 Tax=Penicillium brevicompactum TaxID=5074 RepID=A0A9W9RLH9_PENBR|nr:Phytanoyl-CoA dioxygenase [Penicillium brevicompactum]
MPATLKRFSALADPHVVHQYLKADGVVVIEGASTRETIDDVLEEIETVPDGQTYSLASKSATFATTLLMNPLFIDQTNRILTDTCIIYYEQERTVSISEPQVSQTSLMSAEPGAVAWGLRRQDECHHVSHPAKRESDLGIMFAANDVTKDNGAIRVVIGSNNWNDKRDPTPEEECLVELRKGDALLCLGSTFYGRAANKTVHASVLLTATSTPGYLRQEENQYLAVPWEVADKYPTAVQRFLGYYVSRPYGGAVEHMEPLDFLKVKGDWSRYHPVDLI